MSRILTVVFRRCAAQDKSVDNVNLQGFSIFWPDGRPVAVGLDAFCRRGRSLLGLTKLMRDTQEATLRLVCHPQPNGEVDMFRIPGYRCRRFFLKRENNIGRLHFMNGVPTSATFDLKLDEAPVLEWIGLPELVEGEVQWMDLAAVGVECAPAEIGTRPSGQSAGTTVQFSGTALWLNRL